MADHRFGILYIPILCIRSYDTGPSFDPIFMKFTFIFYHSRHTTTQVSRHSASGRPTIDIKELCVLVCSSNFVNWNSGLQWGFCSERSTIIVVEYHVEVCIGGWASTGQ